MSTGGTIRLGCVICAQFSYQVTEAYVRSLFLEAGVLTSAVLSTNFTEPTQCFTNPTHDGRRRAFVAFC